VTEQAAVQNDPVRIADDVMAYLTSKGAINEAIDLKAQFEGKTFQFYLVRLRSENKDIILVDYDGRTVLQVELFAMGDPLALDANTPLKKQVLHTVTHFDDGPWVDVLRGALYAGEFSKWDETP
jgi:hypothetical protein